MQIVFWKYAQPQNGQWGEFQPPIEAKYKKMWKPETVRAEPKESQSFSLTALRKKKEKKPKNRRPLVFGMVKPE